MNLRSIGFTTTLCLVGATAYFAGSSPRVPQLPSFAGLSHAFRPAPDIAATVEFLQRDELAFLVTERVVTQVVTEAHNGNLVTGYGNGLLVGKVELLYGLDLAQITPADITVRDGVIHVRVPEPELLRYVPDLASLRYMEKKTALLVLVDRARGEDLYQRCLDQLETASRAFAADNDLRPTRASLVARLNQLAPLVETQAHAQVVFE